MVQGSPLSAFCFVENKIRYSEGSRPEGTVAVWPAVVGADTALTSFERMLMRNYLKVPWGMFGPCSMHLIANFKIDEFRPSTPVGSLGGVTSWSFDTLRYFLLITPDKIELPEPVIRVSLLEVCLQAPDLLPAYDYLFEAPLAHSCIYDPCMFRRDSPTLRRVRKVLVSLSSEGHEKIGGWDKEGNPIYVEQLVDDDSPEEKLLYDTFEEIDAAYVLVCRLISQDETEREAAETVLYDIAQEAVDGDPEAGMALAAVALEAGLSQEVIDECENWNELADEILNHLETDGRDTSGA